MNSGRLKARARFAGSAAILALSAGAAMAQEGVEQVVVSSTRLQAAGFDAPTPTTVISAADLESQAKPNVFDSLKDLPALQGFRGFRTLQPAQAELLSARCARQIRDERTCRTHRCWATD